MKFATTKNDNIKALVVRKLIFKERLLLLLYIIIIKYRHQIQRIIELIQ